MGGGGSAILAICETATCKSTTTTLSTIKRRQEKGLCIKSALYTMFAFRLGLCLEAIHGAQVTSGRNC